jgi:L-ascorbate metabolism protein UlaG (beta-lactamase superfamily)
MTLRASAHRGALLLSLCAAPTGAGVRITYLANAGVLIEGGGCSVLIDALQRDSLGDYLRHAPDVQERLEAARPPFDRVGLALATHYHLDHWDAGAISRFLTSSPAAVFASPPQAGAMLPTSLKPRVRPLWPAAGEASVRLVESGARVDGIPLDHGMPVENLAYRLECGGRLLFHLGDSVPSEANFAKLLAAGRADVALVPHWWLTSDSGLAFLKERWRPGQVVAFHVAAADSATAPEIRRRLPDAWVCTEPGESRSY